MVAARPRSTPPVPPALSGQEVVIAGQLSSLPRAEAEERIAAAGGRLVRQATARTTLVVLGDDELPLGEDGALSGPLADARARIEQGQALELIGEAELLERLGEGAAASPLRRLYTAVQLGRILDLPVRRISGWVRAGLIRPAHVVRRLSYFEFRGVAQARALARLTARGVTPQRIRSSLEELARWWPGASTPLAQLDALADTGRLCVHTPEGDLAESSGQLRLAFPDPAHGAQGREPVPDAELWFQRALRLEQEERIEDAVLAYGRALDPAHPRPEVGFNLGNALYALGRLEDACAAFTLATELDAEYVEAWNNLGNALSLLGRHEEARAKLEHALALEPGYADAHFNLAETLAASGALEEARAHWRAYLALDPDSAWAAEVHARLRRTDRAPRLAKSTS